jgi:hypothetical protein
MMFKKKREEKTEAVRQEIVRGLQLLRNLKDSDFYYNSEDYTDNRPLTTNIKVLHTEFGYTVESGLRVDFDFAKGIIKALGDYTRENGQSEEDSLEVSVKDKAAAEKIVKFIAGHAGAQDLIDPMDEQPEKAKRPPAADGPRSGIADVPVAPTWSIEDVINANLGRGNDIREGRVTFSPPVEKLKQDILAGLQLLKDMPESTFAFEEKQGAIITNIAVHQRTWHERSNGNSFDDNGNPALVVSFNEAARTVTALGDYNCRESKRGRMEYSQIDKAEAAVDDDGAAQKIIGFVAQEAAIKGLVKLPEDADVPVYVPPAEPSEAATSNQDRLRSTAPKLKIR